MKGKVLSSRERKIIFSVFNYFKTENPSLKWNALVEMTVKVTGALATSVKRISKNREIHYKKTQKKESIQQVGRV